jgi:hypothetical protein
MPTVKDQVILNLATFRENLKKLMNPAVLKKFAEFIESTGQGDESMLQRYKWFAENSENGENCRYAVMAKEFFLKDQADSAAQAVIWLYHNWAKTYERPTVPRRR